MIISLSACFAPPNHAKSTKTTGQPSKIEAKYRRSPELPSKISRKIEQKFAAKYRGGSSKFGSGLTGSMQSLACDQPERSARTTCPKITWCEISTSASLNRRLHRVAHSWVLIYSWFYPWGFIRIIRELIKFIREPIRFIREPIRFIKEPIRFIREPIKFVREPIKFVREPIKFVREPIKFVREPIKFVREPIKFVREPIKFVKEPIIEACIGSYW